MSIYVKQVSVVTAVLSLLAYLVFNIAVSEPVTNTVNLTWERPTARQDGRSLDVSEIVRTNIRYSIDGGPLQWGGNTMNGASEELMVEVTGEPGEYLFFASVVTTDGLSSVESEPAFVNIPAPDLWPPNTVTNLEGVLE